MTADGGEENTSFALGGEPDSDVPFFRREVTDEAIRTLAQAESITVIVGAGASAEVDFPLWNDLILRLLHVVIDRAQVAGEDGPTEDARGALCQEVLDREGHLGAATIVRARLEDENSFIHELRTELFRDVPREVRPGATAEGVARLFWAWPERDCYVLTTNYDLLLEQAIHSSANSRLSGQPLRRLLEDREQQLPSIYYLHGFLTDDSGEGIVLSESDYLGEERGAWQETLVRRRFKDSYCLFVGSSLADPNLLGYLIRNPHEAGRVFAIFVRPGPADVEPDIPSDRSQHEVAAEQLALSRWEQLGVTALYTDYQAQPSQFLHEVAFARECFSEGREYESYGDRLDRWFDHTQHNTLGLVNQDKFEEVQDELHETAAKWVRDIRGLLSDNGLVPEDREEFIATQLWTRIPERRSMAMTVCSDRSWRRSKAVDWRRIMLPTRQTAISAFCFGREREFKQDDGKRHWNYVQAFPVAISGPEWGRLPVGAVALLSTKPPAESVFGELDTRAADSIRRFLVSSAADLLDPGSTEGVDLAAPDADEEPMSE